MAGPGARVLGDTGERMGKGWRGWADKLGGEVAGALDLESGA